MKQLFRSTAQTQKDVTCATWDDAISDLIRLSGFTGDWTMLLGNGRRWHGSKQRTYRYFVHGKIEQVLIRYQEQQATRVDIAKDVSDMLSAQEEP